MNLSIDRDNFHHAYLLEGEYATLLPEVRIFLEGDSNVTNESYELFTIDDARTLRARQIEHGHDGKRKWFIIGARFFTREAENALLKMFEEPAADTHFFLIVPNAEMLLPTLRSRLMVIRTDPDTVSRDALLLAGQEFLRLTAPERLAYIATMLAEYEDEEKHERLKGVALTLLDGIELALHATLNEKLPTQQSQRIFKELLKSKSYLRDRGASTKMLLEHMALLLP